MGKLDEALAGLGSQRPRPISSVAATGQGGGSKLDAALAGLGPGTATGGKGKNPFLKILEVLDLPRAAIVSGAAELGDVLGPGDASLKDFVRQTKEHIGVGDILAETSLPLNVKRALGFVGDVVLDPLTYAGGVGVLKGGSQAVARKLLAEGAVKTLGKEAAEEAASRVLRRGVSSLTKDELAALGTRGGTVLRGIGPKTATGARELQILPAEISSIPGRALAPVIETLRNSKAFQGLTKALGGSNAELKMAMRQGSVQAFKLLESSKLGKAAGRVAEQKLASDLNKVLKPFRAADDKKLLVKALEGDAVARVALSSKGLDWTPVRTWLDEAAETAGLPTIENYFPRRWSPELKDYFASGRAAKGGTVPAEVARELEQGAEFLGEQLTGATPAAIRDEIERIARERFGDQYRKVFSDDPVEVLSRYTQEVARRITRKTAAEDLVRRGVFDRLPTKAAEPVAAQQTLFDHAGRAANATGRPKGVAPDPQEAIGQLKLAFDEASTAPALVAEKVRAKLDDTQVQRAFVSMIEDGLAGLKSSMSPEDVADAITRVSRATSPEGMRGFLRVFDELTRIFKSHAILTPGFHIRNFMGGTFNNYLADVKLTSYRGYLKLARGAKRGTLSGAEAELWQKLASAGVLNTGQTAYEVGQALTGTGSPLNPFGRNFALTRGSARLGEGVENVLRGSLAYDVLAKGGTVEDAISSVAKYQFDYSDLSQFEQSVARRLVPFYTWTRNNLPLQVEQLVRQPGKYTKYLAAKRNIELGTEEEDVVPGYFGDILGIRTPFKIQGSTAYLTPDLPFRDLAKPLDIRQTLSQLNPILKTPAERFTNQKFFTGFSFARKPIPVPGAWKAIPGLVPALDAIGVAKKDATGDYVMSDKDAYSVESFLPLLSRARRLAPSEPKYQQRVLTTWLSTVLGVGARINTPSEQESELRRRAQA